jgi:cytochrome c-type biogenesis protein CcmH
MLLAGLGILLLLAMSIVVIAFRGEASGPEGNTIDSRVEANKAAYKQRLVELEAEGAEQDLDINEIAQMKLELQRALLADIENLESERNVKNYPTKNYRLILILLCLLPILTVSIYNKLGAAADLEIPQLMQQLDKTESEEERALLLNDLTQVLQSRFERKPKDLTGAYMLATLYQGLGRDQQAISVFRSMLDEIPEGSDRATIYGQIARSQYRLNDGQIDTSVQVAIDEALTLNPDEYNSMGLLANEAFNARLLPEALNYWRRQLSSAIPGSAEAQQLQQIISLLASSIEGADMNLDQTNNSETIPTGATLTLKIDISPEMKVNIAGDERLFIYVRNPAVRPPLIAQSLALPEFPYIITLNNSMSMTGATLESSDVLMAGARISKSGTALANSGDLQGSTSEIVLSEVKGSVTVLIDEIVP